VHTRIYFVRHARPDYTVRDDRERPLTTQGAADAQRIAQALLPCSIARVYSSPYRRVVQTVEPLARERGLSVEIREDLRERQKGTRVADFREFARRQWSDFDYHLDGGESLREAQSRNIVQVRALLAENLGRSIVAGTHGTALSLILNHYDSTFGLGAFESIVDRMPWVVSCDFRSVSMTDWREFEL